MHCTRFVHAPEGDGTLGAVRLLAVLEGHAHPVTQASFCDHGAALLSVDTGREVWWWDLSYDPRSSDEMTAFLAAHTPWALDEAGHLAPRR